MSEPAEDGRRALPLVDAFGFFTDFRAGCGRTVTIVSSTPRKPANPEFARFLEVVEEARGDAECVENGTYERLLLILRHRAREGCIPETSRGEAWRMLLGAARTLETPSCSPRSPQSMATTFELIARDLHRTLPGHVLFKGSNSVGQRALKSVLHRYVSLEDSDGYCQGMGLLVAVLLTQMDAEMSLSCFHAMMHNPPFLMLDLYRTGFCALKLKIYQLRRCIEVFLPRLHRRFVQEALDVSAFASQWLLTLYAYQFPFDLVLRVWDVLLADGWAIIFQVALTLLQQEEATLLEVDLDEALLRLKTLHGDKHTDDIIARARSVPLHDSMLEKFACEFHDVALDESS